MKRILCLIAFCLFAHPLLAQWASYYFPEENSTFDGGVGMTFIDDQSYYAISLYPDLRFGKIGIGLGINLLYNTSTGDIRSQDWDESYDWARIIRYLRYGRRGEDFYTRIGALDIETLGHGFIMNFYNNQVDYDERKLGLTLNIDFRKFGFESISNNLGRMEVIGGRAYVRPFHDHAVPILRNFAIGGTYLTDVDPDVNRDTDDNVSIWGFDIEVPIIKADAFNTMLYADHAQIQDFGSGQALGLKLDFHALFDYLRAGITFERRFLGPEFIPNYFGPFYEVMRYSTMGELVEFYESQGGDSMGIPSQYLPVVTSQLVSQQMLLPMMTKKRKGWFGALYMDFFHLIRLIGYYQTIDGESDSGMLHFGAQLSPSIPFFALEASYDKRGIEDFFDVTTLDHRSVARVGVGYKIKPYLHLFVDYIWNFEWDEKLQQYKPQERFQPRLAFRYRW